jgi:hypothetical protein
MAHHHDVDSVGGAVGALSGIFGHYVNINFGIPDFASGFFLKAEYVFLNIGITGNDIHSFIMAALCAVVGFTVTKVLGRLTKKYFPEK